MLLPKTIEIGPLTFTVTDNEAVHARNVVKSSEDPWGRVDYGKGEIVLRPEQALPHQRMVLLHEVMHGCWHLTDCTHEGDEKAILALAAPLLDVLRRNPDLVAYLIATDEEPPTP